MSLLSAIYACPPPPVKQAIPQEKLVAMAERVVLYEQEVQRKKEEKKQARDTKVARKLLGKLARKL